MTVPMHMEQPVLQWNNAWLHTNITTAEIWQLGLTILNHKSYSQIYQTEQTTWSTSLCTGKWKSSQWLNNGSIFKMHNITWLTYETVWILMEVSRPQRWMGGEITVYRWTTGAQEQVTYLFFGVLLKLV
jgi:hypothetical protein